MARSHITLAALATAAVPGFDPVQAQAFSTGMHGDFFAAIVTDATALSAPAIAYESLTATTMKISASESIEIGIRAMTPGIENLSAPGVRNKVR